MKKCDKPNECSQRLEIKHYHDVFVLHSDLSVTFNDYDFHSDEIERLSSSYRDFCIEKVGDSLMFSSNLYGFWVKWTASTSVILGLNAGNRRLVDGLCGYYDKDPHNDKRKPDGSVVIGTEDFGDSWSLVDKPKEVCPPEVCPAELYKKAKELCLKVKYVTKFTIIIKLIYLFCLEMKSSLRATMSSIWIISSKLV